MSEQQEGHPLLTHFHDTPATKATAHDETAPAHPDVGQAGGLTTIVGQSGSEA